MVSKTLSHLISELITSYLIEEPDDFVNFAMKFFNNKIVSEEAAQPTLRNQLSDIDFAKLANRRKSIYSESFNPEQEQYKPIVHEKTEAQKSKLIKTAKKIVFFQFLETSELEEIVNAMIGREVKQGDYIIKEGDSGDYFYTVESGCYEAFHEYDGYKRVLNVYLDEGSFGELALLYNSPRACTVVAKSDGYLWAIDRETFRRTVLTNAYKKHKKHEMLLLKVPILNALTDKEKMKLVDALVMKTYKPGERIIREGDHADGMYFIDKGSVRVTVKDYESKMEREIQVLKDGDYFGERGLVLKQPRAASVYALEKTALAFLDTRAFQRLLGPCVKLMKSKFRDYKKQIHTLLSSQK